MKTVLGRVRAAVAILASAGLLTATLGVPTAGADTQVTATEGVNIRSAPSTTSSIVGGLYRGQTVTAVSTAQGWTKIRFGGGAAFVASQYLTKGPTAPGPISVNPGGSRVTTSDVNLRKGPGLSYGVIAVVPDGSWVKLTGKTLRGYAEVTYGARRGWISQQYLASSSTGLPAIVGIRIATADLIIRTTSGSDFRKVGEIKKGSRVAITGTTQNGRAQIIYGRAVRWVTAKYLANAPITAPVIPGLPAIVGTRYATTSLLIRSSASSTFTTITEVPRGTALSITGVVTNGRAQVIYLRAVRWVTARYLSTKPVSTGGGSNPYAVERGLKPNAIKVHRAAMVRFPQIVTYYGVRRDSIPDHPSGRALDLMLPNYKSTSGRALGTAVATWARANARTLGVEYVIWNQHIWNIRRDKEGWRYMASRGSDSANHKNHVHITVFG